MKCPVCSYVYPDSLSRCSRCGRVAPETQAESPAKSTLIEFPATRRSSLPEWRLELNEKVRARKARRSMEALVDEATSSRQPPPVSTPVLAPEPEPEPEPSNPILVKALNRLKAAAASAAEAPRPSASGAATAAARAPVREPAVLFERSPRIAPVASAPPAQPFARIEPIQAPSVRQAELFDPAELLEGLDEDLDSLELAELPKQPLGLGAAPIAPNASLALRGVAALVDLALFCVVSVPFVATTYSIDGDFARPSVVVLLSTTLVLLAVFYLVSMFSLCGRTVGMMFSRTHVVDRDGGRPDSRALFLRVVGALASIASLGVGFGWALLRSDRCGWQDLLSGTRVVED